MKTIETIKMTDYIELHIKNYFSFKSYADVIKVEQGEINPLKCYVKIKFTLDYYINDVNFQIVDINFKNKTCNGFIDLDKAGININS